MIQTNSGLKFSITKYSLIKRWGSIMPGQGELRIENALGQDQQELYSYWEVPDEDFGVWVVGNSSFFPVTWLEYLLSFPTITLLW